MNFLIKNEHIYIFATCIYTFTRIINNVNSFGIGKFNNAIQFLIIILLLISKRMETKISIKNFFRLIIIGCMIAASCYLSRDSAFLLTFLFVITYPSKKISEKLAMNLCYMIMVTVSSVLMLCFLGIIENKVLYLRGVYRHALGFNSPNTITTYVMISCLLFVYAKFYQWKYRYTVMWILILSIVYVFTNSRMALIGGVVAAVLPIIYHLNKKCVILLGKITPYIFAVAAFISIAPVLYFSENTTTYIYDWINYVTSYRLQWGVKFYKRYGFSTIGQEVELITSQNMNVNNWSSIDNSYLMISIKYGWIILLLFIIIYFLLGKYFLKKSNYAGIVVLFITSVIGISENFLFHASYNYSIFLFAETILLSRENRYVELEKKVIGNSM